MTVANLLNVTDGGQQIRITAPNALETLYEGQARGVPYADADYEVVAIYTMGSTIVIGVI